MGFDELIHRVSRSPLWMANAPEWRWRTPAGDYQGLWPQDITRARPGLINLMWLALDLPAPPLEPFDATQLPLFKWVVWHSSQVRVGPITLEALAETTTLAQFAVAGSTLPAHTQIGQLGRIAARKAAHADA